MKKVSSSLFERLSGSKLNEMSVFKGGETANNDCSGNSINGYDCGDIQGSTDFHKDAIETSTDCDSGCLNQITVGGRTPLSGISYY